MPTLPRGVEIDWHVDGQSPHSNQLRERDCCAPSWTMVMRGGGIGLRWWAIRRPCALDLLE